MNGAAAAAAAGGLLLWLAGPAAAQAPPVTAVAFSPDGRRLASASRHGVEVRDAGSWQVLRRRDVELPQIHELRFIDAARLLAVGGRPAQSGGWRVLHWPAGGAVRREDVPGEQGEDVVAAADAAADDDGVVSLALACGKQVLVRGLDDPGRPRLLSGHSRRVRAVRWIGPQLLLTAGHDNTLRLWDPARPQPLLRTLNNHRGAATALAVRPAVDGLPQAASAGADLTVRLWQPTIGRMMRFVRLPSRPLDIAWTPDGARLLAACQDGRLRVIDPDLAKVERDLAGVDGWAYAVAVAPDGSAAAVGGADGQLRQVTLGEDRTDN